MHPIEAGQLSLGVLLSLAFFALSMRGCLMDYSKSELCKEQFGGEMRNGKCVKVIEEEIE